MRVMRELHSTSLVSRTPDARRAGNESERTVPMRSKRLITTAALLASVALASAQNMPGGGRDSGGAQSPAAQGQGAQHPQGGAAGQDRQSPQGGKQGQAQDRAKQGGHKDQTTGQAPQKEQGAQGRDGQQDKAQPKNSQRNRDQTTGQGERQQGQSPSGAQRDQSPGPAQSQTPQRQQGQQGQTGAAPQGQNAPNQAQQRESGGNATLTTEQRTKIRQTVLTGGNVPRATNVNFSVSVGTVVPTSVRVVAVPTVILDIHPQWRGYMYFVVNDQIIIVDRGHRIIAV